MRCTLLHPDGTGLGMVVQVEFTPEEVRVFGEKMVRSQSHPDAVKLMETLGAIVGRAAQVLLCGDPIDP